MEESMLSLASNLSRRVRLRASHPQALEGVIYLTSLQYTDHWAPWPPPKQRCAFRFFSLTAASSSTELEDCLSPDNVSTSMTREDTGLLPAMNCSALKELLFCCCCSQNHFLFFSHPWPLLSSWVLHITELLCVHAILQGLAFQEARNTSYTSFSRSDFFQRQDWDQVLLLFSLYSWRNTFCKWALKASLQVLRFPGHQDKCVLQKEGSLINPKFFQSCSELPADFHT